MERSTIVSPEQFRAILPHNPGGADLCNYNLPSTYKNPYLLVLADFRDHLIDHRRETTDTLLLLAMVPSSRNRPELLRHGEQFVRNRVV